MSGSSFSAFFFPVVAPIIAGAMAIAMLVVLTRVKDLNSRVLAGLALLYPVGLLLEYRVIGPPILRYHLADIGFVPFYAYVLFTCARPLQQFKPWLRWIIAAAMPLSIAVEHELIQIYGREAGGDWGDMMCYAVSFALVLLFARRWVIARRPMPATAP